MQFLTIYNPANRTPGAAPDRAHMDEMRAFVEASMKAGTLVTTGAVMSAANGARVRLSGGTGDAGICYPEDRHQGRSGRAHQEIPQACR